MSFLSGTAVIFYFGLFPVCIHDQWASSSQTLKFNSPLTQLAAFSSYAWLDIRLVYHQSDEAIKAHFNLAVLAYWVVSTTQYQLRRKGCKISWREVKRIADTQVVVSTIDKRIDGNEVEVRQCTEPEQQLSDLYKKLEFTSPPLKRRRKICVYAVCESLLFLDYFIV